MSSENSCCGGNTMQAAKIEKNAAAAGGADAETLVMGVAPETKFIDDGTAIVGGSEACKCGSNCTCNPCNC